MNLNTIVPGALAVVFFVLYLMRRRARLSREEE
jgi:hypothetical protein